jgi:hypothetical protein
MSPQHECQIRDFYAASIRTVRPGEYVLRRERPCYGTHLRSDLRTVDESNLLREWEFKSFATHKALGQILIYVHRTICEYPGRQVRGVIAAFDFQPELRSAVYGLNLNVELVIIPRWMRGAGDVPSVSYKKIVYIPNKTQI